MRVAVFSGSFNPLHTGHLNILRCLEENPLFDIVYLIVSPCNPLKDCCGFPDGRTRIDNARAALLRHPEIHAKLDDIELGMEPPHYTIRTLDCLKSREPDNQFTLVIGADNLCDIRRWRDYGRILTEYGVCVYPRPGYDFATARLSLLSECPSYRIETIDAPQVDISSTEIRKALAEGRDVSECLM